MSDKVIPFPRPSSPAAPEETFEMMVIPKGARDEDRFVCTPIEGDMLIGDHIFPGDKLVVRVTWDWSELTPGRLVSLDTPDGGFVGHFYRSPDGGVILRGSNPVKCDLVFRPEEVEIIGLVEYSVHYP